ncbi:carbamate kinase [Microbacterium sp. CJ77]|uniref:carbamate kinase n=1 Tax=Microbacterium sp. CJ77 TaxID=2079201 RepID=UPI000CD9E6C4|nr:carbamate kinase [Microbacterium sp. CJ77]
MRFVIALGGNALLHRHEAPEAATQVARLSLAAPALARIAAAHQVVFVHGNGPQVGLLARESAEDETLTSPYPLSALGAETQGLIGSLLIQALHNAGHPGQAVTVITHTVVDADDAAMGTPTKFIGAVYDCRHARRLADDNGWDIAADGEGWRRVVPSPLPRRIVELSAAATLLAAGSTVVMGGGGGIPVIDSDGYRPVEAVIDKDHTAALLARLLHADALVILTDVPGVIADYGTPAATVIAATTPALLRTLPFAAGSMGPKVDAACGFVEATGKRAAIGSLDHVQDVLDGTVGTQITASLSPRHPAVFRAGPSSAPPTR